MLDHPRLLFVVAALVGLPFVVAVASSARGSSAPLDHDVALIELRTSDVPSHVPLVGSYERYGGNQPAPWLFYVLAAPYHVFGPDGLALGAALVGWGALVGMLVVADRRGGAALVLWTAVAGMVLVLGRGVGQLTNPWEPRISLLVLGLLVMLVWEVAAGSPMALPFIVAVAVFLAGSWVALVPLVGLLMLFVAVCVTARWFRSLRGQAPPGWHGLGLALGISGVVAGVMLLPVAIEQVTGHPGNLAELRSGLTREVGPRVGMAEGWRALSLQFDAHPVWAGRALPVTFTGSVDADAGGPFPVGPLVWTGSVLTLEIAGRRFRRDDGAGRWVRDLWWMHGAVAVVVAGSWLTLALVTDDLSSWIMEPTRLVGMLCWWAAGWSVARTLSALRPPGLRLAVPVLAAGLGCLVAIATVLAATTDRSASGLRRALVELASAAAVDPGNGPVLVSSDAQVRAVFGTEGFGDAEVAVLLERAGQPVVVEEVAVDRFGSHRARPRDASVELRLHTGDRAPEGEGWELLATADPMTPEDRRRRTALDAAVAARSGGLTGAPLLRAATADAELKSLLQRAAAIDAQPVLELWKRSLR